MRDKVFFDTNILLYAYTTNEKNKHNLCLKLVQDVFEGEKEGIISNQILGEFSNILIKKAGAKIEETENAIDELLTSNNWRKLIYRSATVRKALSACRIYKVPFWDSVIAETMKENGIIDIITENEKDFKKIPGIKVINPFSSY